MQEVTESECEEKTYYVPDSELIPVHRSSLREIRRLRTEHHEREVRHAIQIARAIKVA